MKHITHLVYLILLFLLSGCSHQKKTTAAHLVQQASLEIASGQLSRALELVSQACQQDSSPRYTALQATLLYQLGQYEQALPILQALYDKPDLKPAMRADVMNNLASTLYRVGNEEKALQLWQQLTTHAAYLTPEVAWYNIGLVYLERAQRSLYDKQKYARAAHAFEQALRTSAEYVDALYYLAICLEAMHEYQRAQSVVEELRVAAPDHAGLEQLSLRIRRELSNKASDTFGDTNSL